MSCLRDHCVYLSVKEQTKDTMRGIVTHLGGAVATSMSHANVVVFLRGSAASLETARALSLPVVTADWVYACRGTGTVESYGAFAYTDDETHPAQDIVPIATPIQNSHKIARRGFNHVCFVDMDTVPTFFRECDAQRPCPIPESVFLWCFHSRATKNIESVIGKSGSFYDLLKRQRIELDFVEDTTGRHMCVAVGQHHVELHASVPFTIFTDVTTFSGLGRMSQGGRDVAHIRPTLSSSWVGHLAERLRQVQGAEVATHNAAMKREREEVVPLPLLVRCGAAATRKEYQVTIDGKRLIEF